MLLCNTVVAAARRAAFDPDQWRNSYITDILTGDKLG
jgi:hypothetical protein